MGCSFQKKISLLSYYVCACVADFMRRSQSGPCREVTNHLFFEWFWLGSAAGWCNSRKYRPSAVLAAASVHKWQTTANAKRKKKKRLQRRSEGCCHTVLARTNSRPASRARLCRHSRHSTYILKHLSEQFRPDLS